MKRKTETIGRHSTLVLFLFAFAFRLIYIVQSTDNPLFGIPIVDAHVYNEWADRMSQGVLLWDHVGNYLPIYPAFLALQKFVLGSNPLVNKLIQSLMGSITAVLIAQSVARAWNRQTGLIAGYLLAVNWMLVVFDSEMYAESFSIFFMSLTLWLLIRYSDRFASIFASGFAFALSAGARANLFLLLPFIIGWLIWKDRTRGKLAMVSAGLFMVGTVVVIGPIVARNYYLTGVPMLRAQATWSLYSGISPEFDGLHPPTGILFKKYMNQPLQAGKHTEAEIERYWGHKLLTIIKSDPSGVFLNILKRLLIFSNAREWSQEFDVYKYRSYSGILSLPWPGFWLIGPLGFLGFFLVRPMSEKRCLIVGWAVIGFLSIIFFKASDRYRLPSVVMLTIIAAVALWHIYLWAKTKEGNKLLASAAVLAFGCLISWPDWPRLEDRKTARHEFYIGVQYEKRGQFEKAIPFFEISMNDFQWDPDSPYRIGRIFFREGRADQAKIYLMEALAREPDFPKALNESARLFIYEGNMEDAEKQAQISLRLNPVEKDTLLLLADIRRRQGDTAGEVEFLKHAAIYYADTAMALADRFSDAGNYEDALRLFDRVMKAHDADRYIRVQAAMMAGILSIRNFRDENMAGVYWNSIVEDFSDFTFFAIQARYLSGMMGDRKFFEKMRTSEKWTASWYYVSGLKRWLDGDVENASVFFRRCLAGISDLANRPEDIPQKWAWEDLRKICQDKSVNCSDLNEEPPAGI
jgi:tetratricopeptide (TPR) repeat protein